MTRKSSQPPIFSEEKKQPIRKRQILLGSFLLLLGFLMTISFISFLFHHQSDQSTIELFFDKKVQSQNLLNKIGFNPQTLSRQNLAHGIDPEGISKGMEFLKTIN